MTAGVSAAKTAHMYTLRSATYHNGSGVCDSEPCISTATNVDAAGMDQMPTMTRLRLDHDHRPSPRAVSPDDMASGCVAESESITHDSSGTPNRLTEPVHHLQELARLAASQGRFAMDSLADGTRAAHAPMMEDLVAIRSFASRETPQDRFMPIRPRAVRSLTHYGATPL